MLMLIKMLSSTCIKITFTINVTRLSLKNLSKLFCLLRSQCNHLNSKDYGCVSSHVSRSDDLHPEMWLTKTENHSGREEMLHAKLCTIYISWNDPSTWKDSTPLHQVRSSFLLSYKYTCKINVQKGYLFNMGSSKNLFGSSFLFFFLMWRAFWNSKETLSTTNNLC